MFLYNESVKECNHEKNCYYRCLAILFVVISACGNKEKEAQHQFTKQFKDVEQKQKELQHVMDNIHLKEIDHLSKTDTTDKNSKEFKALQDVKTISYLNLKHIISQQKICLMIQ